MARCWRNYEFMKWYWAILLTVASLGGILLMYRIGGDPAKIFIDMFMAIIGIWAGSTSGSVGWGLFVFFLFPIGFPCFLITQYRRSPSVAQKVAGAIQAEENDYERKDFLECPSCRTMIPPSETKCPKCGWA